MPTIHSAAEGGTGHAILRHCVDGVPAADWIGIDVLSPDARSVGDVPATNRIFTSAHHGGGKRRLGIGGTNNQLIGTLGYVADPKVVVTYRCPTVILFSPEVRHGQQAQGGSIQRGMRLLP